MTATKQIRHGTKSGYTQGCREQCCRKANADYMRELRALNRTRPAPEHVHGTLNGQKNYGCTCEACRDADNRRYALKRANLPADWTW